MSARLRKEFTVALPNRPGELARVLESMAKAGVNVLGFCGWIGGGGARLRVVPDDERMTVFRVPDPQAALEILK